MGAAPSRHDSHRRRAIAYIVVDIEREIDACRFVGVVVTRALLGAEWPTLERSIAVWSDPAGTKGRVIPLLRENVSLPASLRIRNWIDFRDFRDEGRFEPRSKRLLPVVFDLLCQQQQPKPRRLSWAESLERTFGQTPLIGTDGSVLRRVGRTGPTSVS